MAFFGNYKSISYPLPFGIDWIAVNGNNELLIIDKLNERMWCLTVNGYLKLLLDFVNDSRISRFGIRPDSIAVNNVTDDLYVGDSNPPCPIYHINQNFDIIQKFQVEINCKWYSFDISRNGSVAIICSVERSDKLVLYAPSGLLVWERIMNEIKSFVTITADDLIAIITYTDGCKTIKVSVNESDSI